MEIRWCVKVMVWFAGDGIVCEGKVLVFNPLVPEIFFGEFFDEILGASSY